MRALPSDLKSGEKESIAMSISCKLCHFLGLHQPWKTPQCSSNLPSGILFWGRGGENDGQRKKGTFSFSLASKRIQIGKRKKAPD